MSRGISRAFLHARCSQKWRNWPKVADGPFVRCFSDKYSSIDEFNKNKKEFLFGSHVDAAHTSGKEPKLGEGEFNGFEVPQPDFLDHPRLQGLRTNSAEFKYQLHLIQEEFQQEQEKQRSRWEFRERIKGMAAGMGALVAIMSIYLFAMNYKYLKQLYKSKFVFDIDDSKIVDLNDPKANKKSIDKLAERLAAELDPSFVANLKDSSSTPGLYIFGAGALKLPARVPGFDGKYLNAVSVEKDYVVAVDDAGKVYHYSSELGTPVEVLMPHKVSEVVYSGGNYYYLSRKRNEIYCGPRIGGVSSKASGWFKSGVNYAVTTLKCGEFARGEKVKTLTAGDSHVLVLTTQGRVFEAISAANRPNLGQYGLPRFSPYAAGELCVNELYELTNLNYEVVIEKNRKFVQRRTVIGVAAGQNFNVAVESNGNVWTWGDNHSAQCGREVTTANDIQPVPKVAFTGELLASVAKYCLPDQGANGAISVRDAYATNETGYLRLRYESESDPRASQDILVAFGAGLKGQLGISRYIHALGTPRVLKSLVGMSEYNEKLETTQNVGVKAVVTGGDHVFVVLDNAGGKDVVVFGDNDAGQFGNGKSVKSSRPIDIPKLVEPSDLEGDTERLRRRLARKISDQSTSRLQLLDGDIGSNAVEQVVVAGEGASALFYRRK